MEKEPEKGQVWDPLSPQLLSPLVTALFGHFLRNSGGFKHSHVSSAGSQSSPLSLWDSPGPSSVPLFGMNWFCSGLCVYLSPGLSLSGVFLVPDIPLKRLNSVLASGDLQPAGVIAKQGLVKCFAGVVVHLIGHFIVSSNEGNVIKLPELLLCVGLQV